MAFRIVDHMRWLVAVRRIRWFDAVLAAVLVLVMALGSGRAAVGQVPPRHALDLLADALMLTAAVGVLTRRGSPLTGLALASGACCAYLALGYPYGPILLPVAVVVYSVGEWSPLRTSAIACAAALAAIVIPELVTLAVGGPSATLLGLAGLVAWVVVPWALGTVKLVRLQARVITQDEKYRRRAYQERLDIAREVHDVVGHTLATINMQASVALHVLEKRPEQAKVSLEAIKTTSKECLDELRRTLDIFRQSSEPDTTQRTVPRLPQIDALVTAMEASGLRTDVSVAGEITVLPPSVNLAGYRILQESLTNVLRHAGSNKANVVIEYTPQELVIEVCDDGRAKPHTPLRSGGQGISGMRHRAAAVGGTLDAAPRPDGGFRVQARLPIGGPANDSCSDRR